MIDDLPFKSLNYNDGLKALENSFKSNFLLSRIDTLNYITIYYSIEDVNSIFKTKKKFFFLIFVIFTILAITFIFYIDYFAYNQPLLLVEIPQVTLNKPNTCLFGLFSDIFKLNNSYCKYFPSYFIPHNIEQNHDYPLSIIEHIKYEQNVKYNVLSKITYDNIGILHKIIIEYSDIITEISKQSI